MLHLYVETRVFLFIHHIIVFAVCVCLSVWPLDDCRRICVKWGLGRSCDVLRVYAVRQMAHRSWTVEGHGGEWHSSSGVESGKASSDRFMYVM